MSDAIHLCIMSDDLGMHPAINDGIAKAFCDGLLTDANIMAPCPAFRAAAATARDLSLPVGLHATLTCDWDIYRWGPLTRAPSLTTPEGYFKHLVRLAWSEAKDAEVLAELTAQVEAIEAEGLTITHSSYHMGSDGHGRLFGALAKIGFDRVAPLRLARPDPAPGAESAEIEAYVWDSAFYTSDWTLDYPARKAQLMDRLRGMQPGYHLWMVHAALDHPSMDDLCTPGFFARNWARPYRAADQALLLDPQVRDLISELGIVRIPVTQAPRLSILARGPEF